MSGRSGSAGAIGHVALLVAVAMVVSACSRTSVEFVPAGAPLTAAQAERLARTTDISSVSTVDVEDAPEMRRRVLVDLRTRGDLGDRAATLLTRGFPERTKAVPVLVRICDVDGVRSLVVVEASGAQSGLLRYRRLWVFDLDTGSITQAGSYP